MKTRVLNLSHSLLLLLFTTFILTWLLSCDAPGPRSENRYSDGGGWLGVYVQNLDRDLKEYLDVGEPGVLVNDIVSDSPAEKAGLRKQDIIVRFDGRRIRSSRDLNRILKYTSPGDKLKMEIIREGARREFDVRIGEKEEPHYAYDRDNRRRTFAFALGDRGAWLGIQTAELNPDLAAYFDVDEYDGVLVVSVVEESPAKEAGIKAGDVILRLDGKKVRATEDIVDILREFRPGDEIDIELKRDRKTQTLTVDLRRSQRRADYHFDFGNLHNWHNEWRDHTRGMHDWNRPDRKHLEHLRRLDSDIRRKIDAEIRREIELPLREIDDQIRIEMKSVEKELQREMRQLEKELRHLDRQLDFDESF